MPAIDRFLPRWDVQEVHSVELDVTPGRAIAAALAAPAAPGALVRTLFRLRGLPAGGSSIEDHFSRLGFEVLERDVTEVVFGCAGTPWRARGRITAFSDAGPGTVRMAADFRAIALPFGGSRLTTETRVAAVDEPALCAFQRYWRVVGPFSALIRRRWLAAVRRSV